MKKLGTETSPEAEHADERRGPIITITASASRRRVGRRFPKDVGVEIATSELTEDEWKVIAADPVLHITPPTD